MQSRSLQFQLRVPDGAVCAESLVRIRGIGIPRYAGQHVPKEQHWSMLQGAGSSGKSLKRLRSRNFKQNDLDQNDYGADEDRQNDVRQNNKKSARKIILPSIILRNTLLQSELRVVC